MIDFLRVLIYQGCAILAIIVILLKSLLQIKPNQTHRNQEVFNWEDEPDEDHHEIVFRRFYEISTVLYLKNCFHDRFARIPKVKKKQKDDPTNNSFAYRLLGLISFKIFLT